MRSVKTDSLGIFIQILGDPNVISTFRGLLTYIEILLKNPMKHLQKLIPLIQAGVKVEMNYDLIDQYILNNKVEEENFKDDISNKEKKILLSNFDKNLLEYFNY